MVAWRVLFMCCSKRIWGFLVQGSAGGRHSTGSGAWPGSRGERRGSLQQGSVQPRPCGDADRASTWAGSWKAGCGGRGGCTGSFSGPLILPPVAAAASRLQRQPRRAWLQEGHRAKLFTASSAGVLSGRRQQAPLGGTPTQAPSPRLTTIPPLQNNYRYARSPTSRTTTRARLRTCPSPSPTSRSLGSRPGRCQSSSTACCRCGGCARGGGVSRRNGCEAAVRQRGRRREG